MTYPRFLPGTRQFTQAELNEVMSSPGWVKCGSRRTVAQPVTSPARPHANPATLTASDAGGDQRSFSCPCGWRGAMAPVKGGRFGISISDREGVYDFCSRRVAENAVEQLASDHRAACPKARGE